MRLLSLLLIAVQGSAFSISKSARRSSSVLFEATINVAMTREEGKNGKLLKELQQRLGDKAMFQELPCIAHADGPDSGRLAATLTEQDFDYVAVTSPEAAKVLVAAWPTTSKKTLPSVAVVGKATQGALEALGIPVDFCPTKATAKVLVQELPAKGDATTLLYPASKKAATTLQDGLTERGFVVTRLDTYDTVTATWSEDEKQAAKNVDVACFGSPSAVKGWLKNTDNNRNALAACIGETSATACRELEWEESRIFHPEKPGIVGWAKAVHEALESQQVAHN